MQKARIDLTWARAHIAAGRGDARATERLLREAEREAVGAGLVRDAYRPVLPARRRRTARPRRRHAIRRARYLERGS